MLELELLKQRGYACGLLTMCYVLEVLSYMHIHSPAVGSTQSGLIRPICIYPAHTRIDIIYKYMVYASDTLTIHRRVCGLYAS